MALKELFARFWPGTTNPETRLKGLMLQIESASGELKTRIAATIANIAATERKLQQSSLVSGSDDGERVELLNNTLTAEKQIAENLQTLLKELKQKKEQIDLAMEQNHARQRQAAASELLASIYRDFGSDLELNNYLEKFASDTFKAVYTAESQLQIELKKRTF